MKPLSTRLLREVRGARRAVVALGALGVLSGVAAIAQAVALAALVVRLVEGRAFGATSLSLLAILAARGMLSAATSFVAGRSAVRVSGEVRARAVRRWLGEAADVRPPTTHMVTAATTGASSIEPYVARYLPALVCAAVLPPLAVLALLVTDWPSAVIVIGTLPLLPVFAALIGRHTEQATGRRWHTLRLLSGHFLDVMRGLPTLVSYQRADAQARTVRSVGLQHRRATVRTLRIAFLSTAALELLATISVAMVAVCVGLRLAYGAMGLETALIAILLTPEAYWPIRRVGQEFHAAADGAAALDELLPDRLATAPVAPSLSVQEGEVELTYRYPGAAHHVLHGLRVPLVPGLTVLTGPSGCGKTTALEVLAGLRGGTDTAIDISAHLVTQRPFLIPGNVADNLRLGAPSTMSDDMLRAAMDFTGLSRVLGGHPDPLRLPLGDDGSGLSAGGRGLVALTRAVLDSSSTLLLDEPTAHLDHEAAEHVRQVIADLARHRRVVVATHDHALIGRAAHRIDLVEAVAA